jgi:hypothetical protein
MLRRSASPSDPAVESSTPDDMQASHNAFALAAATGASRCRSPPDTGRPSACSSGDRGSWSPRRARIRRAPPIPERARRALRADHGQPPGLSLPPHPIAHDRAPRALGTRTDRAGEHRGRARRSTQALLEVLVGKTTDPGASPSQMNERHCGLLVEATIPGELKTPLAFFPPSRHRGQEPDRAKVIRRLDPKLEVIEVVGELKLKRPRSPRSASGASSLSCKPTPSCKEPWRAPNPAGAAREPATPPAVRSERSS